MKNITLTITNADELNTYTIYADDNRLPNQTNEDVENIVKEVAETLTDKPYTYQFETHFINKYNRYCWVYSILIND